jgi:hypothetical protein
MMNQNLLQTFCSLNIACKIMPVVLQGNLIAFCGTGPRPLTANIMRTAVIRKRNDIARGRRAECACAGFKWLPTRADTFEIIYVVYVTQLCVNFFADFFLDRHVSHFYYKSDIIQ